jgi:nucleoside-diphosphate-sugar epimerase
VGGHAAERLLSTGHGVRVLARPTNVPHRLAERGAEIVIGDLRDPAARADACRGCDAVIHAAALVTEVAVADADYVRVNVEASEALAREAARARSSLRLRRVDVGPPPEHGQAARRRDRDRPA